MVDSSRIGKIVEWWDGECVPSKLVPIDSQDDNEKKMNMSM
jgi:hypothetical protein